MKSVPAPLLLGAVSAFTFAHPAFAQSADAAAPQSQAHDDHEEGEDGEEVIIVQGTRLNRRLQDEPIRVEVIAGEEIAGKAIMRPGNIAMLV